MIWLSRACVRASMLFLLAIGLVATPVASAQDSFHLYGYFSNRLEKVYQEPGLDSGGSTVKESSPMEWSSPFFNIMVQQNLSSNFKAFANLSGADAEQVDVRNMWGEYNHSAALNVRVGKTYRKFGLYNEMLDAVPSYMGIEPPEMFDQDHLILSRTTNVMVHGSVPAGDNMLSYAITSDDGEGAPREGTIPVGIDLNYTFRYDQVKIGTSYYNSNGPTGSDVSVGSGSPRTGVLPWMSEDEFSVFGGYLEATFGGLTMQTEYWNAPHNGTRDPDATVAMIDGAGPNAAQTARFLVDPDGAVDAANVRTSADFTVETWYMRTGYGFETQHGQVMPYVQWDWYRNPETIQSKTWGGDNEAGASDDGQFQKATLGMVYRPVSTVAVKLDGSSHIYKFNGKTESYPELRFDVSFVFGQ